MCVCVFEGVGKKEEKLTLTDVAVTGISFRLCL